MIQPFGGQLDYLHLNIILPVGISFYTFQTLSYTIDIYRGNVSPTNKIVDFSLFVAFFPQLVAGPIEKAKDLLPQISKSPLPTRTQVNEGLVLIVMGYFKKVMIGDTSGRYVDRIFGDLQAYTSPEILTALVLFSVQIYADFSGYSSIARGLAKLLGIELIRNFEQPYLSASISEFWRRWHISLGSWIKEYIYIPLGGKKVEIVIDTTFRNTSKYKLFNTIKPVLYNCATLQLIRNSINLISSGKYEKILLDKLYAASLDTTDILKNQLADSIIFQQPVSQAILRELNNRESVLFINRDYVSWSPELLAWSSIEPGRFYDMSSLFNDLKRNGIDPAYWESTNQNGHWNL